MKRRITYITGGERSGKSSFGQKLALQNSEKPVYLATSIAMDSNFAARVKRHQSDRDSSWETIEEDILISKYSLKGKTVLLDCVTLWLYNIYYANSKRTEASLEIAKKEWSKFIDQDFNLFVISNELGMGVHGITVESRNFVELQGWMNQYIAAKSDEAWLMVSGIPTKIK